MVKNRKDRNTKNMYYNDHLVVAEKEISSRNFCNLVDAAVMLYDEEEQDRILKSNCNTKTEITPSEKEDMDKRIYHLFPRKPRSSLMKFAPPQNHENLNGAATSSSLLDLNTIPYDSEVEVPPNPLQCLSLSSSRSFLAAHSELNYTQSHPSSSSLLVDYNMEEVEKSEMKTNAPNPRRKRRAVQRTTGGKSKKATVPPYSWIGRETPESLVNLMEKLKEDKGNLVTEGPWLIFEKKLTLTDVSRSQSRLLMPFKSLIRNDFLNSEELRVLAVEDENEEDEEEEEDEIEEGEIEENEKNGVGAILMDQWNKKWGLILMSRKMMKSSGNGTLNYALICGWNDVVESNGLEADDDISVWYFRWRERLCFALILPPDMA